MSDTPITKPDYEICKHCPLSLGTKGNKRLSWKVSAGEVKCPTPIFTKWRDHKILARADAHVRRAVDAGHCNIVPSDSMLTQIDLSPWDKKR